MVVKIKTGAAPENTLLDGRSKPLVKRLSFFWIW
jgi:hypothetical protein